MPAAHVTLFTTKNIRVHVLTWLQQSTTFQVFCFLAWGGCLCFFFFLWLASNLWLPHSTQKLNSSDYRDKKGKKNMISLRCGVWKAEQMNKQTKGRNWSINTENWGGGEGGMGKMGEAGREVRASSSGMSKSRGQGAQRREYSQWCGNSVVCWQMVATPAASLAERREKRNH